MDILLSLYFNKLNYLKQSLCFRPIKNMFVSNVKVHSLTNVIYYNLCETHLLKASLILCTRGFLKPAQGLNHQHDFIFIFSLNHGTRQLIFLLFLFCFIFKA